MSSQDTETEIRHAEQESVSGCDNASFCAPASEQKARIAANSPAHSSDQQHNPEKSPRSGAIVEEAKAEDADKSETREFSGDAKTPDKDDATKQVMPREEIIRQYELVERVKAYDPLCSEDLLNRAYVFAMQAHGGQTRKSGDPYFTHPISVAAILTELKADPETIVTALLHDTVEDTDATIEQIESLFGSRVAELVDGVTKLSQLEMRSDANKQAENFRKFVLAMSRDVRVLLVKLADRLHNMRTLHFIDKPEKQFRIASETMQIYAPLAGRIGVQKFREELEDLSFKFVNPDGYKTIETGLERMSTDTVRSVVALAQILREKLTERHVPAEVHSREKRPFSIWRKMQSKGHALEELADIYAFRLIVETVEECYQALGVIHQNFRMIPGEFDDYISTPKPNNYRSIHTVVLAPVGPDQAAQRVEIQIRTKEMHESAERGIAAHWRYKDVMSKSHNREIEISNPGDYDPYDWARKAVEMLQHGGDADEFLEHAKMELFQDQVFCFTPQGRVIALPSGATSIDFAYALHTDIGESIVGAEINGRNKPLRTPLKNGDVVQILRSTNAEIPRDWESLVVTGRAKSSLKRRVREMDRAEKIKLGRRIVESEFTAHGFTLSDKAIKVALDRLEFDTVDQVYEAAGTLQVSPVKIRQIVYPGGEEGDKEHIAGVIREQPLREAVSLDGLTPGVAMRLAGCCTPLPGERIVGLPTPSGGINIHRIDCDALAETEISEQEWLDLQWRRELDGGFVAPIYVTVNNRIGALAHVSGTLTHYEVDIVDIRLRNREVNFNEIHMDILIKDVRHLNNVLTALRASENVIGVDRRVMAERERYPNWNLQG